MTTRVPSTILRVTTETNSIYEIDAVQQRFRRLSGQTPATERMGIDGEWQTYEMLIGPELHESMIIVWRRTLDPDGATRFQSTVTSDVLQIEPTNYAHS